MICLRQESYGDRRVRYGDRRVKNEIYSVMQKMSSELHMSKRQIEGSILAVPNILFERDTETLEK